MTFDNKISENISLSKILDCFLEENENPKIIISFLEDHEKNISDILMYSDLSGRLLSIDFISKCSFIDLQKYYRLLKNVHIDFLIWQILQSNLSERVKNLFRPLLINNYNVRHPYSHSNTNTIQLFDKLFVDVGKDINEICENINRISDSKFEEISHEFNNSLFEDRFYQLDVFENLSPSKQYLTVHSLKHISYFKCTHMKFIRQLLISNIETDTKVEIYNILSKFYIPYYFVVQNDISDEMNILLDKNLSFEEVMMKSFLYGLDNLAGELIFIWLIHGRIDMLKKLLNHNREILVEYFDICDLIEKL